MSTMTQTVSPSPTCSIPASRPRLVTGRFAAALLASFGALTSFYLLLSVTPMYAVSAGAGSAGAGLVTGSLMLTTPPGRCCSAGRFRRCWHRTA
jgi:hypothetical protein